MAGTPARLSAGRIGRPHGLDGSFYVTRPSPRLLTEGAPVLVAGRPAQILRRAGTEERPILRVEGIDDRAAAEALRGSDITVDAEGAPTLEQDEWWAHELEGCEVLDGQEHLGTVTRLIELPSCEALEVRPPGGGDPLLVPMVKDAIRRVEPERRRIEVDREFLGLPAASEAPGGGREPRR